MRTILFTLLIFNSVALHAQLKKTLADKHFENLAYYDAAPMYAELADKYLDKGKGQKEDILRAAISYGKIFDFKKSVSFYKKAIDKDASLLSENNWMDFINQLRMLGEYERSVTNAQKAHELFPDNNYFKRIKDKGLKIESILLDSSVNKVKKMPFNSGVGDFSPVIHDEQIYFTTKAYNPDILAARYAWDHSFFTNVVATEKNEKGEWEKPKVLKNQYHSRKHDGPVAFSPDGKQMVITHNYSPKEKRDGVRYLALYLSTLNEDGEWSELKPFPHDAKNSNTGHGCFSPDGKRLFFVSDRDNGPGGTDIYYSDFKNGEWQSPGILSNANTEGDEMFPWVSSDNVLYFASNGHLGLGGLDVFSLDLNNENSQPVNMGAGINSMADDFALVVDSTGKSGYFSTDRDEFIDNIYSWKREAIFIELIGELMVQYDQQEPLMFETALLINETDNDTTVVNTDGFGKFETQLQKNKKYVLTADKKYFKLQKGEAFNTTKISMDSTIRKKLILNPTRISVNLTVLEKETKEPLPSSKVTIRQLDQLMDTTLVTNDEGKVTVEVDRFRSYWTYATKKGYIDDETRFVTEDKSGKTIELTLELPKIKLGTKFKLENIFYDYNKSSLREESKQSLDKLAEFIIKNDVKIELSSHTDSRGSRSYNKDLSQRRAQSCVNYLIDKGVPKSSIIAKGYGESQLVNKCKDGVKCSEEEHQENRRTEGKILGL